ncbi:tetratricopeptide repeat protein [Candidatus Entotheonella palauensis]|uniref:tetratricopeptide repeat protein n=1 Tax=Candidatus Entotheonella palauensis TaxID=93172 RepID=UPI0015C4667F|nr:tetratricopeptide repeat protein [Candidatus Entotheonella palauensis]
MNPGLLSASALRYFIYCAIYLQLFGGIYAPIHAESAKPGFTADQLLQFADQLLQEGEYFRAITEYRRFRFDYPDDPRQAMALFHIGQAFYRGQQYTDALQTFRDVIQTYPDSPYGRQAWLWQGESLLQQTQYAAAEQSYTTYIEHYSNTSAIPYAHYQRGWTLLYRRQWQAATDELQQIPDSSPLYPAAQQLVLEAREGSQQPKKSPFLAGALSAFLPGAGQLYNGRLGDAALTFLLNGLFIAGTIEAIQHDQLAIAGVLGFFEAGWYGGNVYSAVNGAHKHNRRADEALLQNLEQRFRMMPPDVPQTQQLGLRFSFRFSLP